MNTKKIEELLAEAMSAKRESRPRNGKVYPSDLGNEGCDLAYWRKLRDFSQVKPTPGVLLMFQQGDLLEDQVAKLLGEALANVDDGHTWEVVDTQTRTRYGGLAGYLDLLMFNWNTMEYVVVEVKSKRGNAFRYLDEPKPNNKCQTQHYMAGQDASRGFLVYVDREGQNFVRIFEIERDDEAVDAAILERQLVRDMDTPPECMSLSYKRNHNKGDDSLELVVPWQVTWCNDAVCPCKKRIGNVPSGVIAKIKADGTIIARKPEHEKWVPILEDLIKEEKHA